MSLTKRESTVLYERMNGKTLAEIGKKTLNTTTKKIGVSSERVRELERIACRKVKSYVTRKGWFK